MKEPNSYGKKVRKEALARTLPAKKGVPSICRQDRFRRAGWVPTHRPRKLCEGGGKSQIAVICQVFDALMSIDWQFVFKLSAIGTLVVLVISFTGCR
jgi:hypothetical protein